MMKKLKSIGCFILFSIVFVACSPEIPKYKTQLIVDAEPVQNLVFDRYEDVLFGIDTAVFGQELKRLQQQYRPFLEGDLDNPEAICYLKDFAVDPFSVDLYHRVKQRFPDLKEVSTIVEEVYRHFHYYYPDVTLPSQVFTCVSGINPDIPPILLYDDALVISLDWYLDGDEVYELIGMPQYRARRTLVESMAKDLGQTLYETYLDRGAKRNNLLEEMVDAGRKDFFIEALYPMIADSVLLGYSSSQMQWMEINEGNLWADMVGNQCLYSTDLETYRIFLSDGPFTNEYSHEAPPRLGECIGLHIVRSYLNVHDVSLQELLMTNDLQGVFLDSRYKPKK